MTYTLFAAKGWGSAITEAMLESAKVPYALEESDNWTEGDARRKLVRINPLAQLPTLLLPDGAVMTESAAIAFLLADRVPGWRLVPAATEAMRPRFLRWLLFLVAAIYPTFTYGDDPSRWVEGEAAGKQLRKSTDEHRKSLWKVVEGELGPGPHWLGERLTALDIYAAVMSHWRPGGKWFQKECPKLCSVAQSASRDPAIHKILKRNFPG